MDDAERVIDGRWRLGGRLGRGGMGEVWRASDDRSGEPVAVKVLHGRLSSDPELLARFARELETGRRVRHDNAVQVLGGGRLDDGRPYLVMELLVGRPLAGLLHERGPLPWPVAVTVGRQIARGLGAAHAAGVVHRDLKPENVMVSIDPDGGWRVKVFDFGLSSFGGAVGLTASDVRIGTPTHMSPEYIVQGSAGPAGDFYALGIVLYEILAGRVPFEGRGYQILQAHVGSAPPPLAAACDAPPAVCAAVHALLTKDPAERPSTAPAFEALLPA
jgi:serine/threonine protein kinase